jgi:SAM-dependent methyltransferase
MKNFWNQRYAEDGYAYGQSPNDFLASSLHLIKPHGKVLCLAEGEGRNAIFLAKNGFKVTAVDFSEVGMKKAKSWAQDLNLELETITADLAEFDMGEQKWDAIISIFCHLPPGLRTQVTQKIETSLKPGGILILEAYTPRQLTFKTGGPSNADMMMTLPIIEQELSHLEPLIKQELDRDIHEGKYHQGKSAVVQFLGKKI